jgi:phosphate transport system substrate-binding protein
MENMSSFSAARVISVLLSVLCSIASHPAVADDALLLGGTGAASGLARRLGDAFAAANPGTKVDVVPSMGSTGGVQAVIDGVLHVGFSGRALVAEEAARGIQGLHLLNTPFVFVTSRQNPPGLRRDEVVAIYGLARTNWPDGLPIRVVLRPRTDSDVALLTREFPGMGAAIEKARGHVEIAVAPNDQDNVAAAQQMAGSFTGVTFLQLMTERPNLHMIALDGIEASVTAMESGAYPLAKPIYMVLRQTPSPLVARFAAFVQSDVGRRILQESGGSPVGEN